MDYGRVLILLPALVYFMYLFAKHKKDFYLLCGIASWFGLFYGGKYGLYHVLDHTISKYINPVSRSLLWLVFILYFIKSFQEIRK